MRIDLIVEKYLIVEDAETAIMADVAKFERTHDYSYLTLALDTLRDVLISGGKNVEKAISTLKSIVTDKNINSLIVANPKSLEKAARLSDEKDKGM